MAVVRRIPATVGYITDHGNHVYTVGLIPTEPVPRFIPGQFLHLALDPVDPGGFWPESRAFSIASSPQQKDELTITYTGGGDFTARLERNLAPGLEVWLKLPYGDFIVEGSRDAVIFAGGTGITAFTAFIASLRPETAPNIRLFYGARRADLFVYRDLIIERARVVPAFRAHFISQNSQGILRAELAWPEAAELADPLFYLSGPPAMIAALGTQLRARGITAERIRTDAWE